MFVQQHLELKTTTTATTAMAKAKVASIAIESIA